MRKGIDDIVMGILSIVVPVAIVLSIVYYAAEKRERVWEERRHVDDELRDKFVLCSSRIYRLEMEVDGINEKLERMNTTNKDGD